MRVLQILPYYQPAHQYGGPVRSVHGLNKALVQTGLDVTVFTTNINGVQDLAVPLGKEVLIDGVKVYYYPVQKPRSYIYSPQLKQALQACLPTFDLVHIHGLYVYPTITAARQCQHHNISYLISPRGMLDQYAMQTGSMFKRSRKKVYIRLIEQTTLDRAAAIHFTAEEERHQSLYACSAERAVMVPNALDLAEFPLKDRWDDGGKTDTVLFLSRIHPHKGLDVLIPAFAQVVKQHPRARLRLVGPDTTNYLVQVKALIAQHQLEEYVQCDDMLLGSEKAKAMHGAFLFVLPSYSESFGMSIIEALACGTPVVISDRVNICREIEAARCGVVTSREVTAVANAILSLLQNPTKAKQMGLRGRALVEEKFTWTAVANSMKTVYQSILKNEKSIQK